MLTLPGLIDAHVHLREPGQTDKEDFTTGTAAALAGGFTTLLDMPNNETPITSEKLLLGKQFTAKRKILCDVGFYFGSLGDNSKDFATVQNKVYGLKLFLNETTGSLIINLDTFQQICNTWPRLHPILVHAEENIIRQAIDIADRAGQYLHICHVSSKYELQTIIDAKAKGNKVTCGVTPHHLFLTEKDAQELGPFARMKPLLKSQTDVDFLWKNINQIDIIESDHAPHTLEEKMSKNSPFGIPGLETTLPLLLTAFSQNKISIEQIFKLCYENPAKIFSVQTNPDTTIVVDEKQEWTIQSRNLFTKSKWTPFNGWKVKGKVTKVLIRGTKVFEDEKILVPPGFGNIIS